MIGYPLVKRDPPSVVYFDQLLGAVRTQKLVKLLFFSRFQHKIIENLINKVLEVNYLYLYLSKYANSLTNSNNKMTKGECASH